MFSNLRQWLHAAGDKRPQRRRSRFAQFRGQFELLETRTVLSATIGPLPADVEAPIYSVVILESRPIEAVAVRENGVWESGAWESGAMEAAEHAQTAPLRVVDSYRQDPRPLALGSGNDAPTIPLGVKQYSPPPYLQPQRREYGIIVGIFQLNPTQSPEDAQPKNGNSGSAGFPLSGNSPYPNASDEPSANPPTNQYFDPSAYQDRTSLGLTQPLIPPVPYTIARDSVLRDYQSDSLLLTMIGERSTDDDSKLFDDDRLDSGDKTADHLLQLEDADAPDDVTLSLDALKRERAAIDAALAELHDVKTADANAEQDAARTAERENPADSDGIDFGFFSSDGAQTFQPTVDQQEGGMILLATSGDANASAYDLSTVVLSGMTDNAIAPLRVDASVGVYQAFDVGSIEQLPAVNAASPAAHGSASVRTSAATENAPANKSEQPS
jgi:hypothetical protein